MCVCVCVGVFGARIWRTTICNGKIRGTGVWEEECTRIAADVREIARRSRTEATAKDQQKGNVSRRGIKNPS